MLHQVSELDQDGDKFVNDFDIECEEYEDFGDILMRMLKGKGGGGGSSGGSRGGIAGGGSSGNGGIFGNSSGGYKSPEERAAAEKL